MNCCNNVKKCLDGLLPTHTITSWLSLEKAALRFNFSKKGSYHSHRIVLIHLHTFAKCLLALSISTSLGSRNAYSICIQLVPAIVLHPHKTLLCPLPDLWLSLYVKFIPYMNHAFSLDTHQQKTFPSGRNGSVRVDALRQSRQRHPGGRLLRARRQYDASRCISPPDRGSAVSSRSVGILL